MDYVTIVKELQGGANLLHDCAGHGHRQRRKPPAREHLLEVSSVHVLHHDTMPVLADEVLFEANAMLVIVHVPMLSQKTICMPLGMRFHVSNYRENCIIQFC